MKNCAARSKKRWLRRLTLRPLRQNRRSRINRCELLLWVGQAKSHAAALAKVDVVFVSVTITASLMLSNVIRHCSWVSWSARLARLCSVTSRAILDAPMIRPLASLRGEMVRATSHSCPFFYAERFHNALSVAL